MACGCSGNSTSSTGSTTSSIPFLFTGGGRKRKQRTRKNSSRRSRRCLKKSRRKRRKSQKGGIGMFGNITSNAVNFSNNITGTSTNASAAYIQPAGRSFSNIGNPYMV